MDLPITWIHSDAQASDVQLGKDDPIMVGKTDPAETKLDGPGDIVGTKEGTSDTGNVGWEVSVT